MTALALPVLVLVPLNHCGAQRPTRVGLYAAVA
jgi:hypothetical protein